MINLLPDEKVILVLRRHWIIIASRLVVVFFAVLISLMALLVLWNYEFMEKAGSRLFAFFTLALFYLFLNGLAFLFWTDYYLDILVITSQRIIDVEQRGLFNREASSFHLSRVQDVTVEIKGIMPTLMRYGNLIIQTAGENNFVVTNIPCVYKAQNLILKQVQKAIPQTRNPKSQIPSSK